ncbi:hypothetical protein BC828DRAFT_408477 [Blastocladiella britannica]|nr:hypothetical protein BC828DRAFT_408477 [Blastocladiella britannica]
MGKWTDKLYITASEWANVHSAGGMSFGGRSTSSSKSAAAAKYKQLPFYCCALSLAPATDAVCTRSGHVYERSRLDAWLATHPHIDPATGATLAADDIVDLKLHTNAEGALQCPVTRAALTDASHVVAIATSGNVMSHAAIVHSLEGSSGSLILRDPVDDTPFTRRDVIVLQDPMDLDRNNCANFWHTAHTDIASAGKTADPADNINATGLSRRVLDEMAATTAAAAAVAAASTTKTADQKEEPATNVQYKGTTTRSTGRAAASFTSTSMTVQTAAEATVVADDDFMYEQFCEEMMEARKAQGRAKDKAALKEAKKAVALGVGYVKLKTSLGDLNIELSCVSAPRTCHNFLLLIQRGYYKNCPFHRLIPGFMLQGGDPTGTGRGGDSAWGGTFADEIRPSMHHDKRGLLSMANRGKNTNSSQFFITFAPAPHLDGRHTIFGRVVGGLDVLAKLEAVGVGANDKPLVDLNIVDAVVYADPFAAWKKRYAQRDADARTAAMSHGERVRAEGTWIPGGSSTAASDKAVSVGKYLPAHARGDGLGALVAAAASKRTAAAARTDHDATNGQQPPAKRARSS